MLRKSKARKRRRSTGRGAASRARDVRAGARSALSELEQHHLDVIGLALAALALYLGFVLYAGWDGGRVGNWAETGLRYPFGQVAYAVPLALACWGAALIARPLLRAPTAVNAGGVLVLCALLLAFAAETAGLGADHPARHGYFEPRFYTEHGGAVGEAFYWASTTLFQRLGAQILAMLMLLSGLLLLSGKTITMLLARAGDAALSVRDTSREMARTVRMQQQERWDVAGDEIAITRTDPTQPFATGALGSDTDPTKPLGERAEAREPVWDGDGPEPPDTGQFAYEEVALSTGQGGPGRDPAAPGGGSSMGMPEAQAEGKVLEAGAEEAAGIGSGNERTKGGVTTSEEIDYALPTPKLLERGKADPGPDTRDREAVAKALLEALRHFGVEAHLVGTVSGPHVSRYELTLAPGTKVAKIAQLKDDLAYALASTDIRILAPIPGKKAVGVEVPNQRRRLVRLGDIYAGRPKGSSPLAVWLGKDVSGHAAWTDLALMPHALVAGTTGSGKSGSINAMLCSILLHASPNEVRMVLVDPKRVELNHYERLPHLLTPVVTNPRLAANVLANLIGEMESRYAVMGEARARNLAELNRARRRGGEPPLPHILCVIDELADLMMVAPAEVEDSIIRLAQKSRAVGIHLVLATQRPSTDVITGTIKVNIPARIAFAVASQVDSRVILDQGGAETLLGQGDMLFRPVGTSRLQRIQGAFVTEEEIARLVRQWARQGEPEFDIELLEARPESEETIDGEFSPDQDDLLEDAARIVVESGTASVSMIQRRLRVGYTRAGRLIDMLERRGIISGYEGSKPRQVLVSHADLPRILGGGVGGGGGSDEGPEDAPGEDPRTETELESLSGR